MYSTLIAQNSFFTNFHYVEEIRKSLRTRNKWIDSRQGPRRFQACTAKKSRPCRGTFARANQADRCMNLLHCAQRSTPWLLDTRVLLTATLSAFLCSSATWHFRSAHGWLHSSNLLAVSADGCCVLHSLTTSSFGGKETHVFGSKSATESSTPLSKRLPLLQLTFKRMPKANFWRCQHCRGRSRKRCQQSTSEPITAKP